ncbi:MAG: biopolymer transporter ExbD, partial [Gemmatimonadota bacterium]
MGISTGGGRGQVTSEPNVIPMIDILLVLLIIFMITQPLSRKVVEAQIPPPETAAVTQPSSTQIVLELTEDGGYAINTNVVPKDQLDAQFHALYDARPVKLLFIKSGPDRVYKEVIEAMDIARGAGVQVIGLTPK